MNSPGIYTLAALQLTAARALSILTPITGLDGMTACNLEANFQWGSGGSTCSLIAATTFDAGTTWRYIARFDFTTASAVKIANLSGLLSKAVASYTDLAVEGVLDGVLGNQLAAFVVSTGNYSGTVLSLRAAVR